MLTKFRNIDHHDEASVGINDQALTMITTVVVICYELMVISDSQWLLMVATLLQSNLDVEKPP